MTPEPPGWRGLRLLAVMLLAATALLYLRVEENPPAPWAALPDDPGLDLRLNVNAATARELEALPGIGPVLAERVARYRGRTGLFSVPGELSGVPGIGPKTLERIAPFIVCGAENGEPVSSPGR